MIALSWLLIIAIIGGALALVDGILRLRARGGSTIVGIIEIVVAGLFLLALLIPAIPFGAIVLGVVTLIVLAVALFAGGRTGRTITIIALVAIALYLILANRWLVIPGIN
ncbi:hypothetical protein [Agromyces mariniharenae]|uniref:Uncharacterized protein n=1 Tax=Agromyces mariniharenae TaxID=2604423 RepID=A0A5S4V908_9MICO|nr:hypothetical protein [Agromyces mariniharenae]TYL53060.1 hypothetical protein FYC51_04925 [Agromyces mariniharenae]